jgi:hypothetical protein
MHDAGEAYLGDMPHPLRHRSALGAAFRDAEARLEEAIRDRFRIKADVPEVKTVDRRCWPPSGARSAPNSGTGPSWRTSSRSASSSARGHRTRPPRSSSSATPSSKPGAQDRQSASRGELGSARPGATPPRDECRVPQPGGSGRARSL